ncbi:hypothetical protein GEO20_14760 [Rhodococcus erythropolis]|uniref:cellulose biosynthesis cyclic di-GMP-binding regulatory protein BcsB n=1 Tax=Rhodococcus erythropolis TaxID=1833 RepID=UPI0012922FB0|nr:cellulose biosynthesis cyclic di-GMP-binding regulatory protein BcsB [Rhodococcus erythropolis]MQP33234.1 hypothetical protein [Rhodococcus erythropolis]
MSDDTDPEDSGRSRGDDHAEESTPPRAEYFSGERGRTVPRSAWWILAGALVVLLVFVVVRPAWFTRDVDDTSLDVPADRHYVKSLAGAGFGDGVWLTDDSPSTSFDVTFPADSAREQTRLQLTGTTQVARDSVVFLIVRMDGQQVYKSELTEGENALDVLVDVPEELSSDGNLRVQVQVQGTLDNRTCTPDHSAGMQVHLDPASVVEAALTERVHTVRDAVVSWDRGLTIVLANTGNEWRTAAAQLGIALTRADYLVTYSDTLPDSGAENAVIVGPGDAVTGLGWSAPEGPDEAIALGTVEGSPVVAITQPNGDLISRFLTSPVVSTSDSDRSDPQALRTAPITGNEVPVDSLGADTTAVQITDNHRWRIGYSLADLPGGRLPQSIRVVMQLPASPDDLTWILNVQLNGQLIESRRLDRTTSALAEIPLPATAQLLENTLTLTVQRDRNLGGCDVRETTYPIELEASSALVLGDDPGAGFTSVPQTLAPGFAVYVPDAASAVDELNATVQTLSSFVPAHYVPQFLWGAAPEAGRPFVLIGQSTEVTTPVRIDDGRLLAGAPNPTLDLSSFSDGMIVETATSASGAGGLVLDYAGAPGQIPLPTFGTESARVVTAQGSFVVNGDGTIAPASPPRANSPR